MAHIVVADDDAHIRELIGVYLQNEGFEVTEAEDGVAALAAVKNMKADLVILDIMMPGMDGWELCSTLRAKYPDLPLLMISAKGEPAHKVKGFRLGTDDYMTKPFDTLELVMRVKALLKRYRITSAQTVQLGKLQLNRQAYKVFRGDESFTLPLKEFELLYKLASFPGQIFTRDQLIEQIWGFNYEGDERTVDVHMCSRDFTRPISRAIVSAKAADWGLPSYVRSLNCMKGRSSSPIALLTRELRSKLSCLFGNSASKVSGTEFSVGGGFLFSLFIFSSYGVHSLFMTAG